MWVSYSPAPGEIDQFLEPQPDIQMGTAGSTISELEVVQSCRDESRTKLTVWVQRGEEGLYPTEEQKLGREIALLSGIFHVMSQVKKGT